MSDLRKSVTCGRQGGRFKNEQVGDEGGGSRRGLENVLDGEAPHIIRADQLMLPMKMLRSRREKKAVDIAYRHSGAGWGRHSRL